MNAKLQPAGKGKTAVRYLARYFRRSAFHPKRLLGDDPSGRLKLLRAHLTTGKDRVLPFIRTNSFAAGCSTSCPRAFRECVITGSLPRPPPNIDNGSAITSVSRANPSLSFPTPNHFVMSIAEAN
jgi:hypothetical protein